MGYREVSTQTLELEVSVREKLGKKVGGECASKWKSIVVRRSN